MARGRQGTSAGSGQCGDCAGETCDRRTEPEAERSGGKDGRVVDRQAGPGAGGPPAFGNSGADDRPAFDSGSEDLSHTGGGAPSERYGEPSAAERGAVGFARGAAGGSGG